MNPEGINITDYLEIMDNAISVMFVCEECGEEYPIAFCSLFEPSDLRMLCPMCRFMEKLNKN